MSTVSKIAQAVDLLHKDFKSALLNILKKQKETLSSKLKETLRLRSHQIDCINKEKEIMGKKQIEKAVKNTITEIKYLLRTQ